MAQKNKRIQPKLMGERIQKLRKELGLTQAELAEKINISHTQLARYEVKEMYPPADTLQALAEVFNTTIDFLVNGDKEVKAMETLKETELLNQYKKVSLLPLEEKQFVLKFINAYVRDFNTQKAYAI